MASKREPARPKKMRKVILVICEGVTEENYINLLRTWYRSPIKVISHVEGTKITPKLVNKRVNEVKISTNDQLDVFLMYDMDVEAVNAKLRQCNCGMLLSNPCIELWLLLHSQDRTSFISTADALKALVKSAKCWNNYEKSSFTIAQKDFLKANIDQAVARAQRLEEFGNPSSGIYKLVVALKSDSK